MVEQRKALDAQASGLMILLCMIWGMQQAVLKLAAPDIAPIMQIALRSGLAALLVLPFMAKVWMLRRSQSANQHTIGAHCRLD